jgi:hypothetical protein
MYVPTSSAFPAANASHQALIKFGQSPKSEGNQQKKAAISPKTAPSKKRPEAAATKSKVEIQDPLIIEAFKLKRPQQRGTQGFELTKGQAPKRPEVGIQKFDFSGWVQQKIEQFAPEAWQPTLKKAAEKAKEEAESAANEKRDFVIGTVMPMFTALFGFPSLAVMLAKCNDFFGHRVIRGPIGVIVDDCKDHFKTKAKQQFLGAGLKAASDEQPSACKKTRDKTSIKKTPAKKTRQRKT